MDNTSKLVETDQFREKLIDMVNNANDARTGQDLAERIADHLIADGVMFQKWIPVTERLPEKSGYYLYKADSPYRGLQNGIGVSYFQHKAKTWKKVYNPCVTHWMPLPEPPKEDANET